LSQLATQNVTKNDEIMEQMRTSINILTAKKFAEVIYNNFLEGCLQCFDAVGWAAGRASGL